MARLRDLDTTTDLADFLALASFTDSEGGAAVMPLSASNAPTCFPVCTKPPGHDLSDAAVEVVCILDTAHTTGLQAGLQKM